MEKYRDIGRKISALGNAVRPRRGLFGLAGHVRGESMITYGVTVGLVAVVCVSALVQLQDVLGYEYRSMAKRMAETSPSDSLIYRSPCQDEYDLGTREDGIFEASAAGGGSLPVACHFEDTPGLEGGWTVVAHQLETAPAQNWSAGVQPDRSAADYFGTSFTFSQSQLPPHGAMAVGRRLSGGYIEILDAAPVAYATGDIDLTGDLAVESLTSPGVFYEIHRSEEIYYCRHEPQGQLMDLEPTWLDTLTFDIVSSTATDDCSGDEDYTWSFSPRRGETDSGFAYNGLKRATTDPYSWLVLVR